MVLKRPSKNKGHAFALVERRPNIDRVKKLHRSAAPAFARPCSNEESVTSAWRRRRIQRAGLRSASGGRGGGGGFCGVQWGQARGRRV